MTRLLLALSRCLSPALRREFGPALEHSLAETWRRESGRRSWPGRVALGGALLTDLLRNIALSRWQGRHGPQARRFPTRERELVSTFLSDIVFGFRNLTRTPVAAAVMLATLVLAIGGGTTVFTLVNAELLHPLPYREADALVNLAVERDGRGGGNFSALDLADLRAQASSLELVTGFDDRKVFNLTGIDEPARVFGAAADAAFFDTLGVEPLLGRTFLPAEDRPGAPLVVVLGEGLWRSRFAADPELPGRTVRLNDLEYTVVGIAPASLKIPDREQLWVPLATHPYGDDRADDRSASYLEVVARVAPDRDLEAVRSELAAVSARLSDEYPETNRDARITLTSLRETLTGRNRGLLAALLGAAAALLLIACVNVAALQVSRAESRRREMGVRLALGATRGRISRQLLAEAIGFCSLAGFAGALLAAWSRGVILVALPGRFPRLEHVGIEPAVLGFVAAVTLGAAILAAVLPALLVSARSPLAMGSPGAAGGSRRRLRTALVMAEIALALALCINAGLLLRTVQNLSGVDNGYDSDGLLTASISLPESRYDEAATIALFDELLTRLDRLGTVTSAAAVNRLPVSGGTNIATFSIEGRDAEYEAPSHVRMVSPDYFEALRIPLLEGRLFESDDFARRGLVAIVDSEFASRHFPDGDAIGAQVQPGDGAPWFSVVGVVGSTRHWGPRFDPEPTIYAPAATVPESTMMLALRTRGDPLAHVPDLRAAVHDLDPDLPVHQIRTMQEALVESTLGSRASAAVFGLFAALAAGLAVLGVYGMLGQSVERRRREVGIRLAVGADQGRIRRLILGEGLRTTVAGLVAGVALSYAIGRVVAGQLYGVGNLDPVTVAAFAALLLGAGAAASSLPARRASRIDPVRNLRAE